MSRTIFARLSTLALAVGALACGTAAASVVRVESLAAFDAAAARSGSDGFDDLALGQQAAGVARSISTIGYQIGVTDLTGAGAASGGNDLFIVAPVAGNAALSTAVAGSALVFGSFGAPVFGIGGSFFGTDVDGLFKAGASLELTLTDVLGAATSLQLANVQTSSAFVGFVSTAAIASFSLRSLQPAGADIGDPASFVYTTVDQLVLGQQVLAVPEPASWALCIVGLAAVGAAARRRHRIID